jgi:GMP synthase-like glutamine amidotransferase
VGAHIGILQTDRVVDGFRDAHGDYPEMFERLLEAADSTVTTTTYWVQDVAQLPSAVLCDAYLITGSRHSVYEDLPWIAPLVEFLRQVLCAQKKIIGVCFGHQLMAHYFGGRVTAAEHGWAVGVHESRLVQHLPWMGTPQAEQVALLSSHKDQVVVLPDDAVLYATNDFCPIAGFTIGDAVVTIQGHPEFSKPYAKALMDKRRDLLGPDVYAQGVASLTQPTHESLLAQWILRFVQGSG